MVCAAAYLSTVHTPESYSQALDLAKILNHSWKFTNSPTLFLTSPDIRLSDLIKARQKLNLHSPLWGLLWNALGCFAWHIWFEQNKRLLQHTLRLPEIFIKEIIKDVILSFKSEDCKKACFQIEMTTLQLSERRRPTT